MGIPRKRRIRVLHLMLAVATFATLLEAESLRRRHLLFQAWANEYKQKEEREREMLRGHELGAQEVQEMLNEEISKPGSTGVTADEWKSALRDCLKFVESDLEMLNIFVDLRRKCERAASHPWETPWPMRLAFWTIVPERH